MKNKLTLAVFSVCVFLIGVEILFVHAHHKAHGFLAMKGSYFILGLAGSILFMFLAKPAGKYFLYRKEDYYD